MKKSRKREFAKENHGETCMCRKCRAKMEAIFFRKGQKIKASDYRESAKDLHDD